VINITMQGCWRVLAHLSGPRFGHTWSIWGQPISGVGVLQLSPRSHGL